MPSLFLVLHAKNDRLIVWVKAMVSRVKKQAEKAMHSKWSKSFIEPLYWNSVVGWCLDAPHIGTITNWITLRIKVSTGFVREFAAQKGKKKGGQVNARTQFVWQPLLSSIKPFLGFKHNDRLKKLLSLFLHDRTYNTYVGVTYEHNLFLARRYVVQNFTLALYAYILRTYLHGYQSNK